MRRSWAYGERVGYDQTVLKLPKEEGNEAGQNPSLRVLLDSESTSLRKEKMLE